MVHESHPRFVNRERELAELRRLADRRGPSLALLYGRRRVGKTYLLDHAWEDRRVFYFLAERLELIWRERNFSAPEKSAYRHRIADNAVRFWYHFVHPNRSRIETNDVRAVWTHQVEPHLNDYMGKAFERICRDSYGRRHGRWGLPAAGEWARWEGHDRNRRSIEVDVVARLDDGRMLTGEIKWSSRPVGYELHLGLLRDLEDLSRSGQGWARDALSPDRSAGHIYFSAAGFTPQFREEADRDARLRLIALEDLYPRG